MKKLLLFIVLMMLPFATNAKVKINGIYYALDDENETAEVVFGGYSGDVVIPSTVTQDDVVYTVTSFAKNAFYNSPQMTSLTIPKSVTSIKYHRGFFYNCNKLASIVVEEGNPNYDSREGCNALIETASNKLLYGTPSSFIPNSIATIGVAAMNHLHVATLTTVTIPSHVTCVEDSAFHKCTSLADVYLYAEQVPETGKDIFVESNYQNATLHVPANAVEAYRNAEQWKDFGSIVALTEEDPKPTTEIMVTTATQQPTIIERYTIDGKLLSAPQRGLNIVKMSDGTTRKVVVK